MSIFGDAWNAATSVADAAVNVVGEVASSAGDAIGAVGTVADAATLGLAGGVANAIDDTVLDALDEVTGGIVDIDFDNGNFSASVGIDGIAQAGASIGSDGVSAEASSLLADAELSATEAGLSVSGEAGVDWGPLPYAEANVAVGSDGDIAFDGRAQATIPTQYGLVSGKAEAEFIRNDEVWGGRIDAEGTLRTVDGSVIKAGVDVAYAETEDGSSLSVGVEGSYGRPGLGTVGGSAGYQRIEDGDVVIEGFETEAYVEGFGERFEVGAEHVSIETPDGSISEWNTHIGSPEPTAPSAPAPGPTSGPAELAESVTPTPGAAFVPQPEPAFGTAFVSEPQPAFEPEFEAETTPFLADEPTSFDSAIAAADDFEDSVDDLFADFG